MPIVGFQDVWKTGSRVYVLEDTADGLQGATGNRLLDLGTVSVVNPTTEIEEVRLEDSDGGVKKLVTKELSKFTEKYEVQLNNLNLDNLRYLFYAQAAESFSQAATQASHSNVAQPGYLIKLRSSTDLLYGMTSVDALVYGKEFAITSGGSSTTFKVTVGTVDASYLFPVGSKFRVRGNTTTAANVEYTVTGVSYGSPTLTLTVVSTNGAVDSSGYVMAVTNLENAIVAGGSTTTIKIGTASSIDLSTHYSAGSAVFVRGATASSQNNVSGQVYQVKSVAFGTGVTTLTMEDVPGNITVSGAVAYPSGTAVDGYIAKAFRPVVDWTVVDLERGVVRCSATAPNMYAGQAIKTIVLPRAISGNRLIHPQNKQGTFEGLVIVEWARSNFAQRTVREFDGILTPGPGAFSDTEYGKFPLNIEVKADVTNATNPAGRLLYYKGNLPDAS